MTDTMTPAASPPPSPTSGRGLKIAFAISVALNLGVAGMVAGAWLHGDGPRRGMGRDFAFGPFSQALSPEDRRALRKALLADRAEIKAGREAAKAEFDQLLAALRANPFDPAATATAFDAIVARNAGRLAKGKELLAARIAEMSAEQRLAFADRLESALPPAQAD